MNAPNPSSPQSTDRAKWTPKTLLDWSKDYFAKKGILTARLDGEILLAHVLGCRRIDLYLQFDRPLAADELSAYRELVRARADRTPVAYLTGKAGFWNLMLSVGPGCLVPRPDTETLVEAVVEAVDEMRHSSHGMHADPVKPSMLCLELGTGTGAIPWEEWRNFAGSCAGLPPDRLISSIRPSTCRR